MAEVTVSEFAKVLKVPVDRLLTQLDEAGIKVAGAESTISEDAKLELAAELGASVTVNAREQDPVEVINDLGGAHVAISTAVSPKAFEQAYGSLRRGGTLVFVALPADNEVRLPIFETVLNGTAIKGSIVGTRNDLAEVFRLHAAGRTRVVSERAELDRVNEEFAEVLAGKVTGRRVFAI